MKRRSADTRCYIPCEGERACGVERDGGAVRPLDVAIDQLDFGVSGSRVDSTNGHATVVKASDGSAVEDSNPTMSAAMHFVGRTASFRESERKRVRRTIHRNGRMSDS